MSFYSIKISEIKSRKIGDATIGNFLKIHSNFFVTILFFKKYDKLNMDL